MLKIIILLSLLVISTHTYAADVYMSIAGTKTTGKSTASDWSNANCYNNLTAAFAAMSSGDTLTIDDGTYSGSTNKIWQQNLPPSGSAGNFTVIKARNIPGQNGVAAAQRLKVVFDNTAPFIANNYPHGNSGELFQYVKFEGIRWNGGLNTYINYNYLYFKQCAVQGEQDGNTSTIGISSQNNLFEDVVTFGKGRYKFLFYDPSTDQQLRGDNNNVCRRCISRQDWAKRNDTAQDPIANFSSYWSRGNAFLNSIAIDSDLPGYWMDNAMELSGAFYQPNDDGPHKLTIKGSIVLNVAMAALSTRQQSSGHVFEDNVAIKTAGGFGLSGGSVSNRLSVFNAKTSNFTYRSSTQSAAIQNKNDGLFAYNSPGSTVSNSLIFDVGGYAVNGPTIMSNYLNIYNAVSGNFNGATPSPNLITTNPIYAAQNTSGSYTYPTQIINGSTLATAGSSGGAIGAQIIYKLGKDGTFKGDTDWDTPQGNLWPWPLEEWVQAEMRSMDSQIWSDGVGQAAPYNVGHYDTMPNPNRGFCADGQTLTSYIMSAILPDTTAPTTTANKSGRYTTSQTVTLSANETATIKYCLTAGCTPTTTYSAPFKTLQNIATQTLRYQSTDTAGNVEAVKETVLRKQKKK